VTCDAPLQLAVIVGSTREGRLGSTVAEWLVTRARQRDEVALDVIDLVDVDLPMIYPEVSEPAVQVGDRTAHRPDSRGRLPRGSRPMTTRRALCVVVVGRSSRR
jgi:hypothetical protein